MEWHRAFTAKHKKEHVILPVITILIGILLTFIIAMMYRHYQESITRSELELNAMTYAEHIRADIVNGIGATTAIEEILVSNNGYINRFPAVAEDILTDVIQSIQLVPEGYVREIYPEGAMRPAK